MKAQESCDDVEICPFVHDSFTAVVVQSQETLARLAAKTDVSSSQTKINNRK